MPRPYHSASSIETGARCRRAWAYRYLGGLRDPELSWADIEAKRVAFTPRQRSTALGKAMHSHLEAWYGSDGTAGALDWSSLPAQVALSGAHLLPHPSLCEARTEEAIGDVLLPPRPDAEPGSPTRALLVHGVLWAGYKDLRALPTHAEAERLGLPLGEWVLHDYKSTSSIASWALTPATLATNIAANLYGLDDCIRLDVPRVWARWVYFETKHARRAKCVDADIVRDDALALLEAPALLARELDQITRVEDAPQNPHACGDFGGCPFHIKAGGPCNARRSIGGLIQARVKKEIDMTATAPNTSLRDKFQATLAAKQAAAAATPQADPGPAAAPVAQAPSHEVNVKEIDSTMQSAFTSGALTPSPVPVPAPEAAAPKTRKPRTPAATGAATSDGSRAARVLALNAELTSAHAALVVAQAGVDAVLTQIGEALA